MKGLALLSLLFAACASAPRSELRDRTVFEGFTVERVSEAARGALEDLAYGQWDVRVHDRRVVTEDRIGSCGKHVDCNVAPLFKGAEQQGGTPWATVEVRFADAGRGTAVEVRIKYESDRHCNPWLTEPAYVDVGCLPDRLGSTGVLEREIVDRMRAHLEEPDSAVIQL